MKKIWKRITIILLGSILLIMTLESKTVFESASDALKLCIQSVIPSLFPFLFITGMLRNHVGSTPLRCLAPLEKVCNIPCNKSYMLLLGLLGGYPIGAKIVADEYHSGMLSTKQAKKMICYCNNAAPAFIFGIAGSLFTDRYFAWILWGAQILSALCVAMITKDTLQNSASVSSMRRQSITSNLAQSIYSMALICGWIVLFRVFIIFLQRYVIWIFPVQIQILIIGFLELTNGIFASHDLLNLPQRFIMTNIFLSFGGFCVTMQTASVATGLFGLEYFILKALQCSISTLLCIVVSHFIFPGNISLIAIFSNCIMVVFLSWLYKRKNNTGNHNLNSV